MGRPRKNPITQNDSMVNRPIEDIIKELKNACNCNRYPMFVSVAIKENNETTYLNECLLASLEEPDYITRINKLLLSLNTVEYELPNHIKNCISDLTTFVERYNLAALKATETDINMQNDNIKNNLLVSEGIVNVIPPRHLFVNESDNMDIDDLDELSDYN